MSQAVERPSPPLKKLNRQWIGIDIIHLSIAFQKYRPKDAFGMVPMQKPAREQGRNTNVGGIALANARASAPEDPQPGTHAMPGTQAPSPASVPKDADGLSKHSSSGISSAITPEEPPLQAGAPALPPYRIVGELEDLDGARRLASEDRYQFQRWAHIDGESPKAETRQ